MNFKPKGYNSVSPYFIVNDAPAFIAIPLILISGIFFIANPSAVEILNESHILSRGDFGFWAYFVLAVAIAPVLEESVFRLWLEPRYAWAIALPVALVSLLFETIWIPLVVVPLLVGAAVLFRKRLSAVIAAHRGVFIWISSLMFAVFHLVNFNTVHWAHLFLLVGFTGLALVFAAIRLKKGLGFAILAHTAYNFMLLMFMMPPLFNQTEQFGTKGEVSLIKRGLFYKGADPTDVQTVRCSDCTADRLVHVLFRDYDFDAVTTLVNHHPNPFLRYDLIYENQSRPDFSTIEYLLHAAFGLHAVKNVEVLPVYRVDFHSVDGYESTVENILARTKEKSETERVVTLGGGLAKVLQRHYSVRVICKSGCQLPLLFVYDEANDIEQNLNNLRQSGLLDYERRMETTRVIRLNDDRSDR